MTGTLRNSCGKWTVKTSDLSLHNSQLRTSLLPLLLGRVFHVKRLNVSEQILAEGEIRVNASGELSTVFGSTNSFFRKRGCVSFFDYRAASSKQIDDAIGKCSPYNLPAANPELLNEPNIAFLFLSKAVHDRLIPWTQWEDEKAYSDKVVPWVEAGYPGSVPITLIEEVLRVTIDYLTDSIAATMRRARFRRST